MNPPINQNGRLQAERLGKALANASVPPTKIFHSPLLRAQQTAQTAAVQFVSDNGALQQPACDTLNTIQEIDFGPTSDGTSVEEATARMVATYSQWAMGDLDAKMASDGESGRQVGASSLHVCVHVGPTMMHF